MKSSLRNLSLLTVGLIVCACAKSDPAPKAEASMATSAVRPSERAAPTSSDPAPTAAETQRDAPSLTAAAPATPPSVAARIVEAPVAPTTTPADDRTADVSDQALPLDPADVHVDRFLLTTGVVDREPVDEETVFSADAEKIFAFVQLANGEAAPYSFKVHFESADKAPSPYGITLDVPTSPRYRTWAFTRIKRAPGAYRAVLRTLEGREIARKEFVVVPAEGALHAPEPQPEHDEAPDDHL